MSISEDGAASLMRARLDETRAESRYSDTVQLQPEPLDSVATRTPQSLRAEIAAAAPRAVRPIAKARNRLSVKLDEIMSKLAQFGVESCSNRAVARACGYNNEAIVRGWRDGSRQMPLAAMQLLPSQIFEPLMEYLDSSRTRIPSRAVNG